jgi:hypothetical protein
MNSTAIKLISLSNKLIFVDKETVTSNGVAAKDGAKYSRLTIKELINGHDITWNGPDPRNSFLEKANKLSHNRNTPIFKNPQGYRPHIFIPNMKSTQFVSQKFESVKSPMTAFTFFAPLKSVQWEGGIGLSLQSRDRGDHMELSNFAGGKELKPGSGKPVYDRPNLQFVIDDGERSRMIVNKKQIGDFVSLNPSYIDALYYGNTSHTQEHLLFFAGLYFGVMTDKQMDEIYAIANAYLPILSLPTKPVIYDIVVGINKEGYFIKDYKYHSPNDIPIDLESIKCEWITGGDLDKQTFIGEGKQLNISPDKHELAAIVSCKDRDGKSYSGIPFRSEFLRDERL